MSKDVFTHFQTLYTGFCGHLRAKNAIEVIYFIQKNPRLTKNCYENDKTVRNLLTNMVQKDPVLARMGFTKHPQEFISQMLSLLTAYHRDKALTALVFDKEFFVETHPSLDICSLEDDTVQAVQVKIKESGKLQQIIREGRKYKGLVDLLHYYVVSDTFPLPEKEVLIINKGQPTIKVRNFGAYTILEKNELLEIQKMLFDSNVEELRKVVYPFVQTHNAMAKANETFLSHIKEQSDLNSTAMVSKTSELKKSLVEKREAYFEHKTIIQKVWEDRIGGKRNDGKF